MDVRTLIVTVVLLAIALAALLFRILVRPGSEPPKSLCGGYGKLSVDGEEKCIVCGFKNSDWCPEDNQSDKNQNKSD